MRARRAPPCAGPFVILLKSERDRVRGLKSGRECATVYKKNNKKNKRRKLHVSSHEKSKAGPAPGGL